MAGGNHSQVNQLLSDHFKPTGWVIRQMGPQFYCCFRVFVYKVDAIAARIEHSVTIPGTPQSLHIVDGNRKTQSPIVLIDPWHWNPIPGQTNLSELSRLLWIWVSVKLRRWVSWIEFVVMWPLRTNCYWLCTYKPICMTLLFSTCRSFPTSTTFALFSSSETI